jgi:hypothetical protein
VALSIGIVSASGISNGRSSDRANYDISTAIYSAFSATRLKNYLAGTDSARNSWMVGIKDLNRPRRNLPTANPIGIRSEGLAETTLVHVAAGRSSRIAVSVDDAGVLILLARRILNYVVAAYLILVDVLGFGQIC